MTKAIIIYPLHYPHDAFFLATCQKSGIYIAIFLWYLPSFVIKWPHGHGHSVKLYHMLPQHGRSNNHIWPFRKTLLHTFCNTDDLMTIYGYSGKLCHMLSVTLMIQWPYMVDFRYYRKLSCSTRTCKVWCLFCCLYS